MNRLRLLGSVFYKKNSEYDSSEGNRFAEEKMEGMRKNYKYIKLQESQLTAVELV